MKPRRRWCRPDFGGTPLSPYSPAPRGTSIGEPRPGEKSLVDLGNLLRTVDVRPLLTGRTVLCMDLPSSPCLIRADPVPLARAVTELIREARRSAGASGTVLLRLDDVRVGGGSRGDWVRLEVSHSVRSRDGGRRREGTITAWLPAAGAAWG